MNHTPDNPAATWYRVAVMFFVAVLYLMTLQSCERSAARACIAYMHASQNRSMSVTIGRAK